MDKVQFPSNRCTISDDWKYKDMPVIFMENDLIRIGILAGRGSDIFEFIYKPRAVDFMCRLPKEIHNPASHFSQLRGTPNQMEDYYYGGWQEALPNSPTFSYRGASLGQHGEVWMIPWKHAITMNSEEKVSVKLWVRPLRVPVFLEKTLSITRGSAKLTVEERLVNESSTHLDLMWGHHIAFGLPFLKDGARVITNAKTFTAEPAMPSPRKFRPGIEFEWPAGTGEDGRPCSADVIPGAEEEHYSELAYLSGFPSEARYALWSEKDGLGFGVNWDAGIFSELWFWQERFATQDAPWWGSAYAVGLEPWTSRWTQEPDEEIKKGNWLRLGPGEEKQTALSASVIVGSVDM